MEPEDIDLRHYFEVLWKWKWVVVLLTGIALLTSGVFSFFVLPAIYETKVTLMVSNAAQSQSSVRPPDSSVVDTVSRIPSVTLNTYLSQITSPYFLRRVIEKMGLKDVSPGVLASQVNPQVIKDTNLIEIRVQNVDKALAASVANTLASEFVQFVSETNQERMTKSLAFLSEQRDILREEQAAAYETLAKIQAKPNNAAVLAREITAYSGSLSRFREQLVSEQVERSTLEAGLRQIEVLLDAIPPVVMLPGEGETPISVPNEEYEGMLRRKQEKELSLAQSIARIEGLKAEVASLETKLSGMESTLNEIRNEEEQARSHLSRVEATLSLLDAKMVEAQMAQSLDLGETTIAVVSPALVPSSSVKPRKMLNMAVAAVLGGFLSVLLVFVLDYLDNTLKTREDVEQHLGLGTLGAVPLFEDPDK